MNKKISLEGRKRSGELGSSTSMVEKKIALEKIKQEELNLTQFAMASPGVSQFVAFQREKSSPLADSSVLKSFQTTEVVSHLMELHQRMSHPQSEHEFSRNVKIQYQCLAQVLGDFVRAKEAEGLRKGWSHTQNLKACQLFVDQVIQQLGQQGIRLNQQKVVQQP